MKTFYSGIDYTCGYLDPRMGLRIVHLAEFMGFVVCCTSKKQEQKKKKQIK